MLFISKKDMAHVVIQALFNVPHITKFDDLSKVCKKQHARYMKMGRKELSKCHERAVSLLQHEN